jgi:hypothetical protein
VIDPKLGLFDGEIVSQTLATQVVSSGPETWLGSHQVEFIQLARNYISWERVAATHA